VRSPRALEERREELLGALRDGALAGAISGGARGRRGRGEVGAEQVRREGDRLGDGVVADRRRIAVAEGREGRLAALRAARGEAREGARELAAAVRREARLRVGLLAAGGLLEAVEGLAGLGLGDGRAALVELEHTGALAALEGLGGPGCAGEPGGEERTPHDPSMHAPSAAASAGGLA